MTEGHTGTRIRQLHGHALAASSEPVTLSYSTANGSAAAGSDYQSASGTVTFDAGETSKTISVLVNGDRTGELNETFMVNVGVAAGNAVLGDSSGRGHDRRRRAAGRHQLRDEERRQLRDDAVRLHGEPLVRVQRNGQPELRHGERLRKIPEDYTAKSGSLSFAPGQTSKTITVGVKGDRSERGAGSVLREPLGRGRARTFPRAGGEYPGHGVVKNDDW